jgi:hypothetical protein
MQVLSRRNLTPVQTLTLNPPECKSADLSSFSSQKCVKRLHFDGSRHTGMFGYRFAEPGARRSEIEAAIESWFEVDPAKASAWLAISGLPDEIKIHFLPSQG